jgi:hypothetical protein
MPPLVPPGFVSRPQSPSFRWNREVGTSGFSIQPRPKDFSDRIWQGVFSAAGATYAAEAGSSLLLNRAAYGFDEPTDEVQRPWADSFLAAWKGARAPRVGLSRFVFPAKDRKSALDVLGADVLAAANLLGRRARAACPSRTSRDGLCPE